MIGIILVIIWVIIEPIIENNLSLFKKFIEGMLFGGDICEELAGEEEAICA